MFRFFRFNFSRQTKYVFFLNLFKLFQKTVNGIDSEFFFIFLKSFILLYIFWPWSIRSDVFPADFIRQMRSGDKNFQITITATAVNGYSSLDR